MVHLCLIFKNCSPSGDTIPSELTGFVHLTLLKVHSLHCKKGFRPLSYECFSKNVDGPRTILVIPFTLNLILLKEFSENRKFIHFTRLLCLFPHTYSCSILLGSFWEEAQWTGSRHWGDFLLLCSWRQLTRTRRFYGWVEIKRKDS